MKNIAAGLAAACLVAFAAALPEPASAAAPQARTQAPGFHRVRVGDIEVTALLDGTMKLPVLDELRRIPRESARDALRRNFLGEQVETSINAYLVNTGEKLVLVDTGMGTQDGAKPMLMDNLRAAGYRPEQVDEIYITHMHGDHIGGLSANGASAFPKAVLRIDQHEADFWLSEAVMKRAPEEYRGSFKLAMEMVKPYADAGRFRTFEGEVRLVPGVTSMPAHGHTPGHTMYRVESKGETLLLWGDLMHVAAVQFERPLVAIDFDNDSNAAVPQRVKVFSQVAAGRWMAGGAHVSFPGLGHLRRKSGGPGYDWVPLNYSNLKD